MSKALAELTRGAAELSADEKIELAGILLGLANDSPAPAEEIEAAWETEIQRRIGEVRSGKVRGIPLAEVKRKIKGKLPK